MKVHIQYVCPYKHTFLKKKKGGVEGTLLLGLKLWTVWLIWAELNNTRKHTAPPLAPLRAPEGTGWASQYFTPERSQPCWAPSNCTWPMQLALLKVKIKPCTVHITRTSCPVLPHSYKLLSLGTVCVTPPRWSVFGSVSICVIWLTDIIFHPTGALTIPANSLLEFFFLEGSYSCHLPFYFFIFESH